MEAEGGNLDGEVRGRLWDLSLTSGRYVEQAYEKAGDRHGPGSEGMNRGFKNMTWNSLIKNKKVLFITTKNIDYIRVAQEIKILEEEASGYSVIGSDSMHYAVRLITVYWKLLFTRISGYDTVFLGFAPQLIFPVWRWKFRKKELVIDFFLSLYDTLCCDRKWIKADSLPGKLLHFLDKQVLHKADFILSDTRADGEYFCREFQVESQKLSVLYLLADKNIYHPLNLPRPERLRGKYIILYFGSVLPLQGTDIVLKAMERLKVYGEMYFFFIGPVSDKHIGVPIPRASNIEYIDWLPQEKLAENIDMADLCLAGHFNAVVEKASRTIPGKAYIYQAMGKRMILGENPANRELFDNDKNVIFVEMGDDRALAEAIVEEWGKGKR